MDPVPAAVDDRPDFFPIAEPLDRKRPATAPSIVSHVIYATLGILPLFLGLVIFLSRAGLIATSGRTAVAPWALSIMALATVVVVLVSVVIARRVPELYARSRNVDAIDHKLAQWELRLLLASLPPAAALLSVAFIFWQGLGPQVGPLTPPLLASAALLVAMGPYGYFSYARARHVRFIEDRFPDLLRDLNESYAAGLTMAQAIRVASRGDYGRLDPEIARMSNQVSWGVPFPRALTMFAERVGTPVVRRSVALINKATSAGGSVKDVLLAASRDARDVKAIEQERRVGMTLYIIVIYVAFAVFLGVVAALQGLLVPALLTSTSGVGGGAIGGITVGRVSLDDFRLIYLGIGLVQALGSGIVAGVMTEGSYAAGLKHATFLTLVSFVVLGFVL